MCQASRKLLRKMPGSLLLPGSWPKSVKPESVGLMPGARILGRGAAPDHSGNWEETLRSRPLPESECPGSLPHWVFHILSLFLAHPGEPCSFQRALRERWSGRAHELAAGFVGHNWGGVSVLPTVLTQAGPDPAHLGPRPGALRRSREETLTFTTRSVHTRSHGCASPAAVSLAPVSRPWSVLGYINAFPCHQGQNLL